MKNEEILDQKSILKTLNKVHDLMTACYHLEKIEERGLRDRISHANQFLLFELELAIKSLQTSNNQEPRKEW